jgi:hypothetical protein
MEIKKKGQIKEGNVIIPENLVILVTSDGKITAPIPYEQAKMLMSQRPDAKIKYRYDLEVLD